MGFLWDIVSETMSPLQADVPARIRPLIHFNDINEHLTALLENKIT